MHKDVPKKQRIADNVPTPHALRLLQQSVQPFQSMPLPPHGRTLHRTGEEVKHSTDSANMAVYIKFVPMGISPLLLLWCSHAYPQQIGISRIDGINL